MIHSNSTCVLSALAMRIAVKTFGSAPRSISLIVLIGIPLAADKSSIRILRNLRIVFTLLVKMDTLSSSFDNRVSMNKYINSFLSCAKLKGGLPMAPKKPAENKELKALKTALEKGQPENLYIFHGLEDYLREHYLERIKKCVLTGGMESFNLHVFQGKSLELHTLVEAVEAFPMMSDRSLAGFFRFALTQSISSPPLSNHSCNLYSILYSHFFDNRRENLSQLLILRNNIDFGNFVSLPLWNAFRCHSLLFMS